MNDFVALMRRYCNNYTNCQDFAACDEVMVPDYTLHMGTFDLAGRDEHYKPATRKQFEQFPGLCLTVHGLITNGERLLMHFSEHGASVRHGGATAAWGGIGLYKWNGERLTENYVEQDYYSRRRQLAGSGPNPVEAPAVAPWDTAAEPADPGLEALARDLLPTAALAAIDGVVVDDAWTGAPVEQVIEPTGTSINDLFSAGDRVAFHMAQSGRLAADFTGGDGALAGREVLLHMAGWVRIEQGEIVAGRVIRDRLGLYRRLHPPGG